MAECLVNVTVTSFNRCQSTINCINSLKKTKCEGFNLTVVDNNSVDGSVDCLKAMHADGIIDTLILCKRNMGVAVAANLGWAAVQAPYYVKLDNDVEVLRPDWLTTLLQIAQSDPDIGCVGYYIDGTWPDVPEGAASIAVEYSVGSCILIPQATHELLGFWNEDYGLYGIEDSDFSSRLKAAGLKNLYVANSEQYIVHRHALYRENALLDNEIRKTNGLSAEYRGMFYFHNALYFSGVRPLRVERKFLERRLDDGTYDFYPDPTYLKAEMRYAAERKDFIQHYIAVEQEAEQASEQVDKE